MRRSGTWLVIKVLRSSHKTDFYERELILGHPPKVIWVTTGNTSTKYVRELLLRHSADIDRFDRDDALGCLQLY